MTLPTDRQIQTAVTQLVSAVGLPEATRRLGQPANTVLRLMNGLPTRSGSRLHAAAQLGMIAAVAPPAAICTTPLLNDLT